MDSLKILWFNWRDIRHPLAGGAEVYTHEIARRLTAMGHEIILVTSKPAGLPAAEKIEGYTVLRRGGRLTVYFAARKTYHELREKGWKPDVIIDEINTIPFMTPLYVNEPIIMLIHQLCWDCWRYAIHPLVQPLGWQLEKMLHHIYKRAINNKKIKAIITVSPSTRDDLLKLGYPNSLITIVFNGIDWSLYKDCHPSTSIKEPLVIYMGRITPYKNLQDLIKAWSYVEKEITTAHLVIAGRPDPRYLDKLKKLANDLYLKNISFYVNITQLEKKHLLAKASILVYPSIREGWGQTVIEAAACGTPTIAYNVPGLRDSVNHMVTGILVRPKNVKSLAKAIVSLLRNNELRTKLSINAYKYSKKFSWDKSAEKFINEIAKYIVK